VEVALWGQSGAFSLELTADALELVFGIAIKEGVSTFISELLFLALHVPLLQRL